MKPTVYLAGPILDCTKEEANDWRRAVAHALATENIQGMSPLRCEPLIGQRYGKGYPDPKFGTAKAIGAKNLMDVRMCSAVLAYLPKPLEGRHQSYGTILEVGWAHATGKPVIIVSDDPDIYDHPVALASCGWMLHTLDDAVELLHGLLAGYAGGKNV